MLFFLKMLHENLLITTNIQIKSQTINDNLEAMARQLYDYWFVQFDFPNEDGKPYKSSGGDMVWNERLKREIPKGWNVARIGSILDKVVSTPRLSTNEYLSTGTFPIIDQTTDVYYAGFTNREDALVKQIPAVVFGDHSCAVKFVNFPFARGADGTQILLSKNECVSTEYLYFVVQITKIAKGYARHFSFLKDQPIIIPSDRLANKYEEVAKTLFNQITRNREEIRSLTKQRDELLPLLMNGQVTVNYHLSIRIKPFEILPYSIFFLNFAKVWQPTPIAKNGIHKTDIQKAKKTWVKPLQHT